MRALTGFLLLLTASSVSAAELRELRLTDVTDQLPYGDFAPGRWAWLLTNVQPTDAGSYTVKATNANGNTAGNGIDSQKTTGTNTISAYSIDQAGNYSLTNSRSYFAYTQYKKT